MKKKGFTVVELIICFALISIIVVGMFNIALSYRGNAQTSTTKLELEKYKMDVTREIQNDVMDYSVDHVKYCDNVRNDCIKFVYNDGMEKTLELAAVDPTNRFIQYDGRKFVVEDNFDGIENPTLGDVSTLLPLGGIILSVSFQNNSSIYKIDIPITHTSIEGDYGIHLVVLGTGTNPGIFKSIVNFDPNGGSVYPTSKEVTTSLPYGELPTPTLVGNDFKGWYTERSGGTLVTETTTVMRIRNHTIYARWSPSWYTVTFDPNGGTVSPTTKSYQYTKEYGELPTPTKKGHTFEGWYTARTGGTKITSTSTHNVATSRTLYARWTANEYKITYDKNGGTGTNKADNVQFGESYITRGNFFTRIGYSFTGWNEKANGTGVDWTSRINKAWAWNYDKNVTLYAQWIVNEYKVTFDPMSGSTSEKSRIVAYGNKYGNLPTPTRKGHTFQGWYTKSSGGTKVTADTVYSLTTDQTLYARWKANTYTITYNANGGANAPAKQEYTYSETGSINLSSSAPTRVGYKFIGWATSSNATSASYSPGQAWSKSIDSNNTLYAVWNRSLVVTILNNNYHVCPEDQLKPTRSQCLEYSSTYNGMFIDSVSVSGTTVSMHIRLHMNTTTVTYAGNSYRRHLCLADASNNCKIVLKSFDATQGWTSKGADPTNQVFTMNVADLPAGNYRIIVGDDSNVGGSISDSTRAKKFRFRETPYILDTINISK